MAPKDRHWLNLVIVEATTASIVSKHQLVDKLREAGDDPEEEINPFG